MILGIILILISIVAFAAIIYTIVELGWPEGFWEAFVVFLIIIGSAIFIGCGCYCIADGPKQPFKVKATSVQIDTIVTSCKGVNDTTYVIKCNKI